MKNTKVSEVLGKLKGEKNVDKTIVGKGSFSRTGFADLTTALVNDTGEIKATGLAEAIPHIVLAQIQSGRKFDLPTQTDMVGSIYLAKNPGKTKTVQVRDIKTKETLGTTTITSKDSIQVRAKSPVPKNLQTKVRRDLNGKVVK